MNRESMIDYPPSPIIHRRSLVENIEIENELIDDEHEYQHEHHKLTCSSFFSSTLHSLGIIFGDM